MDLNRLKKLASSMRRTTVVGTIPVSPWDKQVPKSSAQSKDCRLEGNKNFKIKAYDFVLEAYNAGLCYAPLGSKDIPLIYGNRSAVYLEMGEYALAIENIKLARQNGFPADKMAKLDSREETCKVLLEAQARDCQFDINSFLKLSHPPNPKIPFIAGCLELRKCKKHGRGIFTTKDLKTGDIISIEDPAFTWPSDYIIAPYCLVCWKKNKGSLIPCSCCTSVMYCSEECREKAALHTHEELRKADCGTFKKSVGMQREAFSIAGGVTELLALLKGNENKTIFDLDFSNPEDPDYQKNTLIALNGLRKNCVSSIEATADQILNVPPINEKPRTKAERKELLKLAASQFKLVGNNLSRFKGGIDGIYLFKSLLNHSCLPDVHPYQFGGKMVLIVNRPVKAGSQVFDCYGFSAILMPKQERLKHLTNHRFKCDCDACVNDYPVEAPRKDDSFVEPNWDVYSKKVAPAEAVKQFKKNCKYIDENAHKMPCYEVHILYMNNVALVQSLDPSQLPNSSMRAIRI